MIYFCIDPLCTPRDHDCYFIYHMDPVCIDRGHGHQSYFYIYHGFVVYLIWRPYLHHSWSWVCPVWEENTLICSLLTIYVLASTIWEPSLALIHCILASEIYNVFWPSAAFLTAHIWGHLLYHNLPHHLHF
jgi:hypothetical protein